MVLRPPSSSVLQTPAHLMIANTTKPPDCTTLEGSPTTILALVQLLATLLILPIVLQVPSTGVRAIAPSLVPCQVPKVLSPRSTVSQMMQLQQPLLHPPRTLPHLLLPVPECPGSTMLSLTTILLPLDLSSAEPQLDAPTTSLPSLVTPAPLLQLISPPCAVSTRNSTRIAPISGQGTLTALPSERLECLSHMSDLLVFTFTFHAECWSMLAHFTSLLHIPF